MENRTFAYLEKQKISAAMGTLYEPSGLRKVRMHFPKVGRDLEIYLFVEDGRLKNEKIENLGKYFQNQHTIVRPGKFWY